MEYVLNLIKILKEEEKIYKDLLELANKKTEMIAEENMEEMENISKDEEKLIKEGKLIEFKREDEIVKIEKSLNIEKLSDISSLLDFIEDKDLKEKLINSQKDFLGVLDELKRVNMVNNTLIKDALEYISLSLNLMTSATAEGTYGKTGSDLEPQTENKSMFDFKG